MKIVVEKIRMIVIQLLRIKIFLSRNLISVAVFGLILPKNLNTVKQINMRRKEFSSKVKEIRDSIIIDIQKLSEDKENLMSNVKNIKELTSIVKELDRIIESDGEEQRIEKRLSQDDFFEQIRKRVEISYEDDETE